MVHKIWGEIVTSAGYLSVLHFLGRFFTYSIYSSHLLLYYSFTITIINDQLYVYLSVKYCEGAPGKLGRYWRKGEFKVYCVECEAAVFLSLRSQVF